MNQDDKDRQEDRERLLRIEITLTNFKEDFDKHTVGRINDHGNRIRALEVLKFKAMGAMIPIVILVGIAKDWLIVKIGGAHR